MPSRPTGVRWAVCALALSLVVTPSFADRKKKKVRPRESVATCTSFDQIDRVDDSVDLLVGNTCAIAVSCSVSWTVTCAPESKRRHRHMRGQAFDIATNQSQVTNASAAVCGNDAWVIDDVVWSCQPIPPATP